MVLLRVYSMYCYGELSWAFSSHIQHTYHTHLALASILQRTTPWSSITRINVGWLAKVPLTLRSTVQWKSQTKIFTEKQQCFLGRLSKRHQLSLCFKGDLELMMRGNFTLEICWCDKFWACLDPYAFWVLQPNRFVVQLTRESMLESFFLLVIYHVLFSAAIVF